MSNANRRNTLKSLFGADPQTLKPEEVAAKIGVPRTDAPRPHTSSGAVKAMGLSLGDMSRELENARKLKESLASGDRVVLLSPELIDNSIVEDRLAREQDPDFQSLVNSIRDDGQQVPILVRPHPEQKGRYQAAYGQRRLRAARTLGIDVKAVIRELSDVDLVLAQGKENSERRDLSFIERAVFAHALIRYGFDRATVQRALSLHKADMTRYLQVLDAVPLEIVNAIGPAPKVGRPRWLALGELINGDRAAALEKIREEIARERFKAEGSDARFQRLFALLSRKKTLADTRSIESADGAILATLKSSGNAQSLSFAAATDPNFVAYVADALPQLFAEFEKAKQG
ncbi:plasmid partitioning protein RepB [Limoniibacter endophyticus]|uniref:Plasmid partitioning protein RepB n=1 Tax=Limoniibacter endophyticus TaxID=1565040 RepID=A0A8J3DHQ4_9HYPH|nr:plasmid partitioning protein RepB [Limoniibacter endophyticus]GHC72814.1 plasmid partitioning protein RepB [Limoniibacter endophyticus]